MKIYNYKQSVPEKVCINQDQMSLNEIKQTRYVQNISTIFHLQEHEQICSNKIIIPKTLSKLRTLDLIFESFSMLRMFLIVLSE